MPEERRINIRVSPEEFKQMDKKRFEEDRSFQEIGLGLFRAWLQDEMGPIPRDRMVAKSPNVEKLETIEDSGDEIAISAVTQNIDLFHDRLRPAKKSAGKRRTGT